MERKRLVAVVGLVTLLLVACGGDRAGGGSDGAGGGGGSDGAGGGSEGSLTLTAVNFAFEPASLRASAGGSVEFVNQDDVAHNFTAENAGLSEDVDAGDSLSIDLGGVEPGTYDFFCKYHPDQMTGTLELSG